MARAYHGHAEIEQLHEVGFNDTEALERRIAEVKPACVLMEGAMTSARARCRRSRATSRPCAS